MKKILALLVALCACSVANAQNISLDLRDTPVRSALEMVFKNAGIKNFVIDNDVSGIVGRIDVKDQSVESALKLIIRANSDLLTYTIENDVYIVKKRKITSASLPVLPDMDIDLPKTNSFDVIHLNYIDPFDLQSIFGPILFISQYQRYQGGGMNGMGAGGNVGFGGAGGFGNGAMGGNGGLGLGAGNGMGGGAMGGLGGMMGFQGGLGGGMGGFGGGRNF